MMIALQQRGLTMCWLATAQAAAMVLTRPPPSPEQQERAWRSQGMGPLVDVRGGPVQATDDAQVGRARGTQPMLQATARITSQD